jgi:hypothetical protein
MKNCFKIFTFQVLTWENETKLKTTLTIPVSYGTIFWHAAYKIRYPGFRSSNAIATFLYRTQTPVMTATYAPFCFAEFESADSKSYNFFI